MSTGSPERDERVMSLVEEALQTPPPERDSFLHNRCQNDLDLYREVSEIVAWEERMGDFLRRPLIEVIDFEDLEQIFEPGQTVAGRFEILRRVGDGGMGVVYEARDNKRKKRIAIKCAKPGFSRLLSPELERACQVRHQNICLVNEIHTTNTELGELDFLTMEFLDGETLAHRLKGGKLEAVDAGIIARQLCSGLAEAHGSGVLHRDLKPGNVILCRKKDGSPRAVITDFGLATETSDVSELEGGTPNYMAPELWRGGKASQASDVFSLGVMLYEMVTGCKPFPALSKQNPAFPTPIAPTKLVKKLPSRWDAAILPCLKENPDERCSAKDVLAALKREAFYHKPAVLVAIAACFVLALFLAVPPTVAYFAPAPTRLAILPVQAPSDLVQQGQSALNDLPGSINSMQPKTEKATVSVIPLSKTLKKGVISPEQAEKILGATHVLQLKLSRDDKGMAVVEGSVSDLEKHERNKYSAHFSEDELKKDLPSGLAGTVAFALDVPRKVGLETVNSNADPAYKNALDCLDREFPDLTCAIQKFQAAAQQDPHSPLPLAGLAKAFARKSQAMTTPQEVDAAKKEAKAWLSKAEALNADSPRVRLASGLLHLLENGWDLARRDFKRVEIVQPNNVEALLGLAYTYDLQGEGDSAIPYYSRAIAVDGGSYKPYINLASLYFYDGDYAKAEDLYGIANQLAPGRPDIAGSLAAALIAEGKDNEAEKLLKIVEGAPPGPETALAWNNAGAQFAFNGKDIEAIRSFQKAVHQAPNNYMYLLNLADAQRRMGRFDEAKTSYRKGRSLTSANVTTNPTSAAARAFLAYSEARLGLKDQARSDIAEAMHLPRRDDQVLLIAVQTYEALGDRNEALKAAALTKPQTLKQQIKRHPDLVNLRQDPEFIKLLQQKKAQ